MVAGTNVVGFFSRLGFTGKGGFIHPQGGTVNQAPVSGYPHTGIQQDNIARNQHSGGYFDRFTAAHDTDVRNSQFFQGGDCTLSPVLLNEAKNNIKNNDNTNGDTIDHFSQEKGNAGGNDQNDDHYSGTLLPYYCPGAFNTGFLQLVQAMLFQAFTGVCRGQAGINTGAKPLNSRVY
jgi:hypothetical protein